MTAVALRDCGLVVMAKAPKPGRVMTRLCPPLHEAEAARLQQSFIEDIILRPYPMFDGRELMFWGDAPELRRLARSAGWSVGHQLGADLGERMSSAAEVALSRHDAVFILGTDSPTVPTAYLQRCRSLLEDHDVVYGPSEDGGYWGIGVKPWALRVFRGIRWSTPAVCDETEAAARREGLQIARGPMWYDVDRFADLRRMALESSAGTLEDRNVGIRSLACAHELLASHTDR